MGFLGTFDMNSEIFKYFYAIYRDDISEIFICVLGFLGSGQMGSTDIWAVKDIWAVRNQKVPGHLGSDSDF